MIKEQVRLKSTSLPGMSESTGLSPGWKTGTTWIHRFVKSHRFIKDERADSARTRRAGSPGMKKAIYAAQSFLSPRALGAAITSRFRLTWKIPRKNEYLKITQCATHFPGIMPDINLSNAVFSEKTIQLLPRYIICNLNIILKEVTRHTQISY